MSAPADPFLSRAVLIGTGGYDSLSPISAIYNNLLALAEVLRADHFWGLPAGRCVIVEDPATTADMLDPVRTAAHDATDTLLVYYAGHGLVDPHRSELHLTLTGSDPQRIYTAVPYALIRDLLLDSRAVRRIVILDCCYSGRALGQMAASASAVVDEASAEGTFVLAASAENKVALAPQGERYTAFTGELLAIIRNGVTGYGPVLDLDCVYQHLLASMRSKGFPLPQKRDRNTAGQLALIRNQAFLLSAANPSASERIDTDGLRSEAGREHDATPLRVPPPGVRDSALGATRSSLSASATRQAPRPADMRTPRPQGQKTPVLFNPPEDIRTIPQLQSTRYPARRKALPFRVGLGGGLMTIMMLIQALIPSSGRGDNPIVAGFSVVVLVISVVIAFIIDLRLRASNTIGVPELSSKKHRKARLAKKIKKLS
jgi:Caspase domain